MTRVLFVDDQPQVLSNLRKSMRSYRQDWTMVFCEGAEQALENLADEPFDVVISDIEMTGMDGNQLFSIVKQLCPRAIRIAMSERTEHKQMLRSVGSAHQFVAKPCNPELIYHTISRATRLATRLGNPRLEKLAAELESLPSLPSIYIELMDVLRSGEASVDQVGALIARDVGMTAKVLQLVNSSYFGLPVHVADASHAAALLGLNMLKPLVLAAGIFRQLENSRVPLGMLQRTIEHSMAVGCLARQLTELAAEGSEIADNAMIAGVLHDMGKLVLADNFGEEYVSLGQTATEIGLPLRVAEVERYGATHATVGGYLLGLWGLPQDILEAVAYHHDPSASTNEELSPLTFVHTANALLLNEEAGDEPDPSAEFDMIYLRKLGLDADLDAWCELVREVHSAV